VAAGDPEPEFGIETIVVALEAVGGEQLDKVKEDVTPFHPNAPPE